MARFHLSWEIDHTRLKSDPKEIAAGWKLLAGLVRQHLETGVMKEWGAFPGEHGGYCVLEGEGTDVMTTTMQYAPYVRFQVRPVASIKEVSDFLDAASR